VTDRLNIEGWMVAEANLEHGYAPYTNVDRVFVFRNPTGWATVTIARHERYADDYSDRPTGGQATVTTSQYASLDELAAAVEGGYRAGGWLQILDAGHEHDPDLYAAWVPEQMRRDLNEASIYNKDLAYNPGYFDPAQLGAPGRTLPNWQTHALGAMAATLTDEGWDVFHDQEVKVTAPPPAGGILSTGTEIAGALRARRYGYEAAILVRVDDCGEIYARLAEAGDVTGPALRAQTDEDDK
jgi:hypothetical protein